jgi:hypothetical protein
VDFVDFVDFVDGGHNWKKENGMIGSEYLNQVFLHFQRSPRRLGELFGDTVPGAHTNVLCLTSYHTGAYKSSTSFRS